MNYYYVQTYNDIGDFNYYVFADSEIDAIEKLTDYWKEYGLESKTIHRINEPKPVPTVLEADYNT